MSHLHPYPYVSSGYTSNIGITCIYCLLLIHLIHLHCIPVVLIRQPFVYAEAFTASTTTTKSIAVQEAPFSTTCSKPFRMIQPTSSGDHVRTNTFAYISAMNRQCQEQERCITAQYCVDRADDYDHSKEHEHKHDDDSKGMEQNMNANDDHSPWSKAFRKQIFTDIQKGDSDRYRHRHSHRYRYICIITETDACDSDIRMEQTIATLQKALGTYNHHAIDLISIRVIPPPPPPDNPPPGTQHQHQHQHQFQNRLKTMCKRLMAMKEEHQRHELYHDYKIVMNDVANLEVAMDANLDGIHVKEKDVAEIPRIRKILLRHCKEHAASSMPPSMAATTTSMSLSPLPLPLPIIGTSAHSIESGLSNWNLYRPDYMFVGTCYLTQSHPEKDAHDLEGPKLPGIVKAAIEDAMLVVLQDCNVESDNEADSEAVAGDGNDNDNGNDVGGSNIFKGEGARSTIMPIGGDCIKDLDVNVNVNVNVNARRTIPPCCDEVSPIIFAIGGIEANNCHEPVGYGADGVAVIRSVMQASDPAEAVQEIKAHMK